MLCPSKEKRRQKSGGAGTDTTYAGQTLTGRVTAMDGTAGSNGAQVEFTADGQVLTGDIVVDTISTLNMTLTNGTINFNGYTITLADGTVLQ